MNKFVFFIKVNLFIHLIFPFTLLAILIAYLYYQSRNPKTSVHLWESRRLKFKRLNCVVMKYTVAFVSFNAPLVITGIRTVLSLFKLFY